MTTTERTDLGQEIETALVEVLAHGRGETALSCRIVDAPAADRIVAIRKRLKLSRRKFADRFGLDVRAVQDWERGQVDTFQQAFPVEQDLADEPASAAREQERVVRGDHIEVAVGRHHQGADLRLVVTQAQDHVLVLASQRQR